MSASLTGFKSSGGRNTDSQSHVFHVAVRKSESDRVTRAADVQRLEEVSCSVA